MKVLAVFLFFFCPRASIIKPLLLSHLFVLLSKIFGLLGFLFLLWYTRCRLLATGGNTSPLLLWSIKPPTLFASINICGRRDSFAFRGNSQVSIQRRNNVAKKALERGAAIAPSPSQFSQLVSPRCTRTLMKNVIPKPRKVHGCEGSKHAAVSTIVCQLTRALQDY